jgi:hypothetical protein
MAKQCERRKREGANVTFKRGTIHGQSTAQEAQAAPTRVRAPASAASDGLADGSAARRRAAERRHHQRRPGDQIPHPGSSVGWSIAGIGTSTTTAPATSR